jgi:hypothetical protein
VTRQSARQAAEAYVAKQVEAQRDLGYRRPEQKVVRAAVDEATAAVKALGTLAPKRP